MKSTVRLIKITPILINIYLLILLVCTFMNIELMDTSYFLGHSMYLDMMLWSVSKRFKFCVWHRILIGNMFLQSLIQAIDYYMNFTLEFWIVFSISAFLMILSAITSTILYFKYGCCKIEESK